MRFFKKHKEMHGYDFHEVVNDVKIITETLTILQHDIEKLKREKDAILFNECLNKIDKIEWIVNKRLKVYEELEDYVDYMNEEVKSCRKDIQLILYGAKFG